MAEGTERLFVSKLSFKMATQFRDIAAKESRSRAISKSLNLMVLDFGKTAVETPYYWAVYYHDGRGAIRARPGHKLVYFKNIADDPRVSSGNYPVRESDVKSLTKSQFYRFLRDPSKGMVVADSVGPTAGDPFFDRAARKFKRQSNAIGEKAFSAFVRECMGDDMQIDITGTFSI